MNVLIREAMAKDCPQMMQLIHELAVYEKAPGAVTVSMEHFIDSGFGPGKVWSAFVAEADGEIAGFALYYTRYSTWKGKRLYLEDLLVTEKLRGNGLGKMLFDRLILECTEQHYSGMVWQVLDWNEPAINFYKKYGADIDPGWLNCSLNF